MSPTGGPPRSAGQLTRYFERHAFSIILVTGMIVRAAQILGSRPHPGRIWSEIEQMAQSLALHGSLADPYLIPTGPTAHASPGMPVLLALLYLVFGVTQNADTAARLVGALVSSVQYALLPSVSVALGLPRLTGAIAGLLAALASYKGFVETVESPPDQPYAALALVLLFLHTHRVWTSPPNSQTLVLAIARGCAWGVAMLFSPVLGLVFAAILAYEVLVLKRAGRLAALLLAFTAIQAPWVVRNWIELHGLVLTRSNFGLEFRLSNRPESSALMEDNVSRGMFVRFHPALSPVEVQRVRELGEVPYNREQFRLTQDNIRRDPGRFVRLTLERIWSFWLHPSHRTKTTVATTLVSLLGLIGLLTLPRCPGVRLAWLILLTYPLVYYVLQVDRRYRYPIEWIFIPPAIFVLSATTSTFRRLRPR